MDKTTIIKAVVRFVAIVLGLFGVNIAPEMTDIIVQALLAAYALFEVLLPLLKKDKEDEKLDNVAL